MVLRGLKSLINGIRGRDVEERAPRVVASALVVISWCEMTTAIRRRVARSRLVGPRRGVGAVAQRRW